VLRIVIIDDEERIRSLIKRLIADYHEDFEVIGEASDGIQGFKTCMELFPDVVLADIRMPGMDGIELMNKLKEENEKIQFIIISGYDEFSYAQQSIQVGAIDYILKPVKRDLLYKALVKTRSRLEEIVKEKKRFLRLKQEIKKLQSDFSASITVEIRDIDEVDNTLVRRVLSYIHENLTNEVTLENAAEKVFLNPSYLSDLFKQATGKCFSEYVTNLRIEKAKVALVMPELKIFEISGIVGFTDPNYFSTVFKKATGMSPSMFRYENDKKSSFKEIEETLK